MSVIYFQTEELQEALSQYRAIQPGLVFGPDVEDLAVALVAFHYANASAYHMTYGRHNVGDEASINGNIQSNLDPDIVPITWQVDHKRLAQRLRLFLYNAISNGGTDFMPEKYKSVIRNAAQCIVDKLAGIE